MNRVDMYKLGFEIHSAMTYETFHEKKAATESSYKPFSRA